MVERVVIVELVAIVSPAEAQTIEPAFIAHLLHLPGEARLDERKLVTCEIHKVLRPRQASSDGFHLFQRIVQGKKDLFALSLRLHTLKAVLFELGDERQLIAEPPIKKSVIEYIKK